MPSKNTIKAYSADAYYHLYNRGIERRWIFVDNDDKQVFLNLLKRYLRPQKHKDRYGRPYVNLAKELELLAYCLMPNHFHLLVYQHEPRAISALMQRVVGSYTIYFNQKYGRSGPLFENRYKAALINNEAHLWHISRYIHLNPGKKEWRNYPYSSLANYLGERKSVWLRPERILAMHKELQSNYVDFVADWEDYQQSLPTINEQLA